MTFHPRNALRTSAFTLALAVGASGCGSDQTGGGLLNPNAGSISARDKASTRVDLPAPDLNAGQREPIAEAASSSPSGTGTNAGSAAEGGGQRGAGSESKPTDSGSSTPRATPPVKENAGAASGATKPSGSIQDGTPRSPQ